MANELPYFKFIVQAWQNGKISLESYELKGLFIEVCGYLWINDCSVTLAMLKKKYSNATAMLDELIEVGILKHEKRHDKVEIDFLSKQALELNEKRKRLQYAGSKGGKAKASVKQNSSIKIREDKIREDKNIKKETSTPTLEDLILYFSQNGYSEIAAKKAFDYYSVADWKDSKGNKVKNWKQKMQGVWFKPENKIIESNSQSQMVW